MAALIYDSFAAGQFCIPTSAADEPQHRGVDYAQKEAVQHDRSGRHDDNEFAVEVVHVALRTVAIAVKAQTA